MTFEVIQARDGNKGSHWLALWVHVNLPVTTIEVEGDEDLGLC